MWNYKCHIKGKSDGIAKGKNLMCNWIIREDLVSR